MSLGDYIHEKLNEQVGSAPARLALTNTVSSLLARYLPPDETQKLTESITDYARTNDFASAISAAVGEPKPEETEDQFVARAKSAIEDILTRRFDK